MNMQRVTITGSAVVEVRPERFPIGDRIATLAIVTITDEFGAIELAGGYATLTLLAERIAAALDDDMPQADREYLGLFGEDGCATCADVSCPCRDGAA